VIELQHRRVCQAIWRSPKCEWKRRQPRNYG